MTESRKEKLKTALKVLKEEFSKMVASYVETHPEMTLDEIGAAIGIHRVEVIAYCKQHNISRVKGKGSTAYNKEKKHGTQV